MTARCRFDSKIGNALHICYTRGTSTRLQPFASGIRKAGFNANLQMMHAKHADRIGLNDLPGLMTGCEFFVLNAHGNGYLEMALEIALANAMRQVSQNDSPTVPPAA